MTNHEHLAELIAQRWYAENPGWNTAPARREIALLALEAIPDGWAKLDGEWGPFQNGSIWPSRTSIPKAGTE